MRFCLLFAFVCINLKVITDGNKSTLIVNEVFPEDEGEITCTAVNTFGMAQSKTNLTVESMLHTFCSFV